MYHKSPISFTTARYVSPDLMHTDRMHTLRKHLTARQPVVFLLGSGAKRFVIILMMTCIPTVMSDPHLRGNQVTLVDEVSWKWNDRTDTDHKDDLIDHLPSNVVPPLHHTTDVKTPLTAALRSSPPTEVEAKIKELQ